MFRSVAKCVEECVEVFSRVLKCLAHLGAGPSGPASFVASPIRKCLEVFGSV